MFDYNARSIIALPEFLRARGWRDPGTYADCAFMLGCRTALPMWEFRDADPECSRVFDLGMQSEIVAALSTGKASGPFPFGEELKSPATAGGCNGNGNGGATTTLDSTEEEGDGDPCGGSLTIVDLGGGRGQALIDMREDHPALLQGARLVLVDLAPVIDSAREAGLPPWVEPVKGSFFEPLPIRGMWIRYLTHLLTLFPASAAIKVHVNRCRRISPPPLPAQLGRRRVQDDPAQRRRRHGPGPLAPPRHGHGRRRHQRRPGDGLGGPEHDDHRGRRAHRAALAGAARRVRVPRAQDLV